MSRRKRRLARAQGTASKGRGEPPRKGGSKVGRRKGGPKGNKGKRKGLWWKISLGVIVVALLTVIVGYNRVIAFLHSETFRKDISQRVGDELGCEAEFGKFKWNGLSGRNSGFKAHGDGLVSEVALDDLAVDVKVDYLKRDKFRLKNVKVGAAEVSLDTTKPFTKIERPKVEKTFLSEFLPDEVELEDVQVRRVAVNIHSEAGDFKVSQAAVALQRVEDNYDLSVTGGRVILPFPLVNRASIKSIKLRQSGDFVFLNECELGVFNSGHLSISGDLDFTHPSRLLYQVDGVLEGLEVREVISSDWQKSVSGSIVTSFKIRPNLHTNEPEIHGKCEVKDGVLKALPILDKVASYLGESDYRVIKFDRAEADFSRVGKEIQMRNIKFISKGLITVEGDVTLRGETISGLLHLGLPAQHLRKIPGAETIVFKPGKNGLHWTYVKIGGTLAHMTEDLTGRLIAAAGERMLQMGLDFAGEIASGNKGIIDAGTGLVEGLMGSKTKKNQAEDEKNENGKKTKQKKEGDKGGLIPKLPKLPEIPKLPEVPKLPEIPKLPGIPDVLSF